MSILNKTAVSDFSNFSSISNFQGIKTNSTPLERQTQQLSHIKNCKQKFITNIEGSSDCVFKLNTPFTLESGSVLNDLKISYSTYGQLNADASNVIWVCHALTADANPKDWWSGLLGEECYYNPKDYFIVCANVIASPYGSTSPLNCDVDKRFDQFPMISIRDNINAFIHLRKHLKINKIHTLIGGSMGGH